MPMTTGFTGKSELYSQYRPSYPQACLDYLADDLGLRDSDLADIGCGTGILTTALAAFAGKVYAVDSTDDMLRVCREAAAIYRNIDVSFGRAENTGLPDHCVEAVTAAQSFHWFDREAFRIECRRILKGDGPVILIWNSLLSSDLAERLELLSGPAHKSGLGANNPDMVAGFYPDNKYTHRTFPNYQTQTRPMFIGRYLSSSYAPKEADEGYELYIQKLNAIFDDYQANGTLNLPYQTVVYSGQVG